MADDARLIIGDDTYDLPVLVGTEGEHGLDISRLRGDTGHVTVDPGYGNTAECRSNITYVDGERGILRYRGIPIEQLAMKSNFLETSWLLIYGELPARAQLDRWSTLFTENAMLNEGLHHHFDGFPSTGHPMAILSAMINAIGCYDPAFMEIENSETFQNSAARLISKIRTIAAAAYKTSIGQPIIYPKPTLDYAHNFLHMMFSVPYQNYVADDDTVTALSRILICHADHEQNCSASTVRMVASSGANLYACCAAGVCALWGPAHGGANEAVVNMLQYLHDNNIDPKEFLEEVKSRDNPTRLMGFGHRVYKNFDPRALIMRDTADQYFKKLRKADPLLEIAKQLEEIALRDSFFVERKLYPNVDFYSGILLKAMGIPVDMFTVMFAMGRMPGWIAHWREARQGKISLARPRQIYEGSAERDYVPMSQRTGPVCLDPGMEEISAQ